MGHNKVITGIDVGTDKCVTLIATTSSEGVIQVVGVSAVPSKGMKKSQIIDLEKVLETITESLDGAERMAGLEVKSAFISLSGTHIQSLNSKGVVAVASPDQEITSSDVDRVIEAARAISLSSDREIIHVIPKDYRVDSQEGIKDPVGMTGVRLESEAHIITGMSTALKNMEKCIQDLGITVAEFVFSGIAAANVVLSETEKELGVAVIDIGAGSTSVCVFMEGSLSYSCSIPIGARHITQDIALGCRVSIDTAEKIKLHISSEKAKMPTPLAGESKVDFSKRAKKADQIKVSDFDSSDSEEILSRKTIVEGIMHPRMQEIFSLVADKLKEQGTLKDIPAGVVITGGGALTHQIAEVAKHELNLPARVGAPIELQGLVRDINTPAYATSIGLIQFGMSQGGGQEKSGFSFGSLVKTLPKSKFSLGKLGSFFRSLLP